MIDVSLVSSKFMMTEPRGRPAFLRGVFSLHNAEETRKEINALFEFI
nr:MAG TPA: hypothetical protein [Caudoviricetes sp.]